MQNRPPENDFPAALFYNCVAVKSFAVGHSMRKFFSTLIIIFALIFTGCTNTPTPTSAPVATATNVPATPTIMPIPSDTPQSEVGAISGQLSYPAEMIPALRVVAYRVDDGSSYFVDTEAGQSTFTIANLPPGTYHVVAYARATPTIAGGYTQAVLCGLKVGCTDQSLLEVIVSAYQETKDINPADWYAPEGTFPPMPTP